MSGRRFLAAAAGLLYVLTFAATEVMAYRLLVPARRWFPQDLPREIFVDPRGRGSVNDPDHGVTATLTRIEGWEDALGVGNLIKPIKGSPADPDAVPAYAAGDGISVIRFDDPAGICSGNCLAATTTGGVNLYEMGDCNGASWFRWTDADIAYNPNYSYTTEAETDAEGGCSGEFYLEGVALHEMGHVLSLGHSADGGAVMYAYVNTCERTKVAIQTDDAVGIRQPYACAFSQGGVYADSDGDGAAQNADCDDQDPAIRSGAAEVCDLKDNDCDGTGDAGEGLICADGCLNASSGIDGLRVTRGACAGKGVPGRRYIYSRGSLAELRPEQGVKDLSVLSCPAYWIYDRFSESSGTAGSGSGHYYLVRNDWDTSYGLDSDGTLRTPVEQGCP